MNFLSFSSPLKRFYKFLLKRILGSFLQYDLDLHQLDVQLGKGEVVLRDLELNVQMLNDLAVDLPITFIRARIRFVKATIPWKNLLSKNCMLKLDGWELVVVPSEQVQHKSSGTFSTLLAQSVMSEIDPRDVALQQSLASLGQHFKPNNGSGTPMSMSGVAPFGTPPKPAYKRDREEDLEEKRHEAQTAAAVRSREKKRKAAEERRRRREEYGEEDEEDLPPVQVSDINEQEEEDDDEAYDPHAAEEARSKRQHSQRQAAAQDTAAQGLKVVASFLEQVVSAIELEVTDITVRIQHQPKVGQKQTNLIVKLPWIHLSDLNQEAKVAAEKKSEEEQREAEERAKERAAQRAAAKAKREAERERRRAERVAKGSSSSSADGAALDDEARIDAEADADLEQDLLDAEAEEEDERAIRQAMEARLARESSGGANNLSGPKFEYHKAIRFHGFRVELHETEAMDSSYAQFQSGVSKTAAAADLAAADPSLDDSSSQSQQGNAEPQTIISGSMDQTCMITLKLKMQDTAPDVPRVESTCFIQSLRALLTPRQLALLTDLSSAIALSSKQVALNAQLATQSPPATLPILNAAGGFSPTLSQATSLSKSTVQTHSSTVGSSSLPPQHPHPTLSRQESNPTHDPVNPPDSSSVINLWSMETHILQCSLTLTETDEQTWSTDWWLQGTSSATGLNNNATSAQPDQLVQSVIPGINANHLYLASHHTFINVNQTSAESTVKITAGSVQLDEYLTQQRRTPLPSSSSPNAVSLGFKSRPLVSFFTPPLSSNSPDQLHYPTPDSEHFLQSARTVAAPHLSVEFRNTVDTNSTLTFFEPVNMFFEPHAHSTINSRLTLTCQPATLDIDLGIGERLKNMLDAVTAPITYLNQGSAQPLSATNSETSGAGFTFDVNKVQNGPLEEVLDQIASNQRRHSLTAGDTSKEQSSYSQTVLIAPTINVNVLFPAYTPSQQQPHPYATFASMIENEIFVDARGVLRPEHLSLELHEVSLANEVDLTAIPTVTDPLLNPALLLDSEWMIRFHKAHVNMIYPNNHSQEVSSSLAPASMIEKRILTTTYPTQHSVSASNAYFNHAALASYISILTRAPIVLGVQPKHLPNPMMGRQHSFNDSTYSPSVDSTAQQQQNEDMFFNGLPNVKHWESEMLNGERKRVFKSSSNASASPEGSQQVPDAAVFESLALNNSGLVVTIHLPVAAIHFAKYDYDLLMFLYTIFSEIMEPPPEPQQTEAQLLSSLQFDPTSVASAAAFVNDVVPSSMYESSLSGAPDEESDQVDPNGLARSMHLSRHQLEQLNGSEAARDDNDDDEDDSRSLSRSDSFSSDSSNEMFESVAGADSVILGNGTKRSQMAKSRNVPFSPANQFGSNSLLKSTTFGMAASTSAISTAAADDAQLAKQVKQFFLQSVVQRKSMTWSQLKQLVLNIPSGTRGNDVQEALVKSDRTFSLWVAGAQQALPPRWQQYRARLYQLFGQIILTPAHLQSIPAEQGDDDDDDGNAPLTRDSLVTESKSDDDEDQEFAPTISPSTSNSPQRAANSFLQDSPVQTSTHPPRDSNLSDMDSDESPAADEELSDSQNSESPSGSGSKIRDRKKVAFGNESIVMGRAPQVSDDAIEDAEGGSEASGSQEINAESIFARASRTAGHSQLFQPPSVALSSTLPPVNERSVASSQYGLQSSMMEDENNPDMFQSFLPAQSNVFDLHKSINPDASIDYSHLPPQVAAAKLAASQALMQKSLLKQSIIQQQPKQLNASQAQSSLLRPTYVANAAVPPVSQPALRLQLSNTSVASTCVAPPPAARLPSPYRHFMSLRLNINRASIVIQDDVPNENNIFPSSGVEAVPTPLPGSVPQSFHVDIGEVRLFQVAEYDGRPVSYIAIRAGDLTVREYKAVITDDAMLFTTPSLPLLFKTMGDELLNPSVSPTPSVDAWGRPILDSASEQKYNSSGSEFENSHVVSDSPLTSVFGGRHAHDATSSAWKNPVLMLNFVIKLKPDLNLRETQAVVNLRALTLQYFPESLWIQKLTLFFQPTVYTPTKLPIAFNVTAPAPPPALPVTKDFIHVFLHAYDCALDYNPADIEPRAVVSLDHVHLQTTVYPNSPVSVLKLEVRDVAMYMIPKSSKCGFATTAVLSELGQPYLHRIAAPSLFAELDSIGYARLATMDFLDAIITQNPPNTSATSTAASAVHNLQGSILGKQPSSSSPPLPLLSVEVTNGLLTILTCADSFQVFTQVCSHFAESIQEVQQVAEIDIKFEHEDAQSLAAEKRLNYNITASAPVTSETSGGFNAKAFSTHHQRAAYLLDDDEEENSDTEEQAESNYHQRGPSVVLSSSSGVGESRNILNELDHNAFGADLGVAQVYTSDSSFEMKLNEDYAHERHRQTSLSMALQAAAERELARARREELEQGMNGQISSLGNDDTSGNFYGSFRQSSTGSPSRLNPSSSSASSVPVGAPSVGPQVEQQAKWFNVREQDELVEKDQHERFLQTLPDDESRAREEQLAKEKEERRKRREEERSRLGVGGKDARDQRNPPTVIDDHMPDVDDDTRSGRARLKPPPDYPHSLTEIVLLNLSVCWRMFGGNDWDLSESTGSKNLANLSAADTPIVNNAAMASVAIMDFYNTPEPFVRPNAMSFASPYANSSATASSKPVPPTDVVPRGVRQTDRVMEIFVRGANVRFDQFPTGTQIASRVIVALDDIEIHDLIATSPFKNFLCYYSTGSKGRELNSSMFKLEMTSVRPDPSRIREEYRVKLSVLPLRLHVDQEAVEFFIQFFSQPPISSSGLNPNADTDEEATSGSVMSTSSRVGSAGNFHDLYREESSSSFRMTPARAEFLTHLTHFLQKGGSLPRKVLDPSEARELLQRMFQIRSSNQAAVADAIGYSQPQISNWFSGSAETPVGNTAVEMLNQLLPTALSASRAHVDEDEEDEEDDSEDDEMSAGLSGAVIGVGGGRSPLRRNSTDPLESFQAFAIPPMPEDWIPVEIARFQSHLVPSLVEAYHKYFDTIMSSVPQSEVSSIEMWHPSSTSLQLHVNESVSDYRTRVMTAARTAARIQLKAINASGVREVENQVYIQSFQVVNKIVICVDWKPNTFDLKGLQNGDYAQLANLLPLENMEFYLKPVKMTGITGFPRVGVEMAKLWAYDLSRHQANRYIAAVQPIRSMVNVGAGVADLVLLPISHYKNHGNLKRGVQKGLSSFLKNVSLESMAAAARLAQGAQSVLESVDDVLSFAPTPLPSHAQNQFAQQRGRAQKRGKNGKPLAPASSSTEGTKRKATNISKQANPPPSTREGFRQAYESLSRGFQTAANQLVVVPREEFQKYGSKGAVKSALKSMPSAVLSPMISGMEAVAKVLNGAVHSLDPKRLEENASKFKEHTK